MAGRVAGRARLSRRAALAGLSLLALPACQKPEVDAERVPKEDRSPPKVSGNRYGLIELTALDPTIRLDIRYATARNFTGRVLYGQPRAFLQREAADALMGAVKELKSAGYGLLIHDGYRPARITQLMWDVTPPAKRNYVANPKDGSRHNRGCAVDLTLYDLATAAPVVMPSDYDDFSKRAHHDFMDAPADAIAHRALLRDTMQSHGFYAMSNEWWHYDFKDWRQYPLLDVPFEAL